MIETERQRILDDEHLRLLRIGYFINGGLEAFVALFGLVYIGMGLFIALSLAAATTSQRHADVPPAFIGWFFALMGLAFTAGFGGLAILTFLTARALRLRRSRGLCLVTAGLSCISIPYGTALGIFTFFVLNRPSVIAMFAGANPTGPLPSIPPVTSIERPTGAPGQGPVA